MVCCSGEIRLIYTREHSRFGEKIAGSLRKFKIQFWKQDWHYYGAPESYLYLHTKSRLNGSGIMQVEASPWTARWGGLCSISVWVRLEGCSLARHSGNEEDRRERESDHQISGAISCPEVESKERLEREYRKEKNSSSRKKRKDSLVVCKWPWGCSAISCLYPQMLSEALR